MAHPCDGASKSVTGGLCDKCHNRYKAATAEGTGGNGVQSRVEAAAIAALSQRYDVAQWL